MKTYTTKLLNKECQVIEVPEKWGMSVNEEDNIVSIYDHTESTFGKTCEFEGYRFVSKLSELTDEDVKDLVEKVFKESYSAYRNKKYGYGLVDSPLESFFSALEAEGLFLNGNPYPKKTFETNLIGLTTHDVDKYRKWHEAEALTFDKTRTILLIKN